jgi:hypothetical protein
MSEYIIKLNRSTRNITLNKITRKINLLKSKRTINLEHVGRKGKDGLNGNDNLFIQDTQPITELNKYAWFETENGNLKTLWVETGA